MGKSTPRDLNELEVGDIIYNYYFTPAGKKISMHKFEILKKEGNNDWKVRDFNDEDHDLTITISPNKKEPKYDVWVVQSDDSVGCYTTEIENDRTIWQKIKSL